MANVNISGLSDLLINWGSPTVESIVDDKVVVAINFAIGFSALVAVVMIIVSGYGFITAAGDPDQIEKAQKGLTASIVGLVIVFLARLIIVDFILGMVFAS